MTDKRMKTVLIIEDEAAYLRTLREKLSLEGFVVFSSRNGEEGLAMALEKHPDVILLDLKMPFIDGIEVARRLRMDTWGKTAKIIILTNLIDIEKFRQAKDSEVVEFYIKTDIKLVELIEKIREMTR